MPEKDSKLRQRIEDALKSARRLDAGRNALSLLFPTAAKALDSPMPYGDADLRTRRRQRRISVNDFAPAYFRLDPQPATWGRLEIEDILSDAPPDKALQGIQERIDAASESDRPRLRRLFIDDLNGAFGPSRPFTPDWLLAIANAAPYYIRARDQFPPGILWADNSQRLGSVVMNALNAMTPSDRSALVLKVMPEARDVTVLCFVVRGTVGDRRADGARKSEQSRAYFADPDSIRDALINQIRTLVTAGVLWSQADPAVILWFWWGCDLADEVHAFTDRAMSDPVGLSWLLEVPIGRVVSTAGDYEKVDRESWSKVVDLDALAQHARRILDQESSDEDRKKAQRLLDALAKGLVADD